MANKQIKNTPILTEREQQAAMFVASIKRTRGIKSKHYYTNKKLNIQVGKNIFNYIETVKNFHCKFYIKGIYDTDFKHMQIDDVSTEKISDGVQKIINQAMRYAFGKSAKTTRGKLYKLPNITSIPNIKVDLTIYGKSFTDIDLLRHNYVSSDDSINRLEINKIYDMLFALMHKSNSENLKKRLTKKDKKVIISL